MVRCWKCQAQLPPRRETCWRCGADQAIASGGAPDTPTPAAADPLVAGGLSAGGYPLRSDADGEYCDDPECDSCDDDWDDGDVEPTPPDAVLNHPSMYVASGLHREHAEMMHPAARTEVIDAGLVPRVFAVFVSMVIWWVVVLAGFSIAMALYDSPTVVLVAGLLLLPILGDTVLIAETGLTPGKYLVGIRVCAAGTRPGWSRSIIRMFVIIGPFLPMLFGGVVADMAFIAGSVWIVVLAASVAIDPDRRGIHDRLAGTNVTFRTPVCH